MNIPLRIRPMRQLATAEANIRMETKLLVARYNLAEATKPPKPVLLLPRSIPQT